MNKACLFLLILMFNFYFLTGQIHRNNERYISDTCFYETPLGKAMYLVNLEISLDSIQKKRSYNIENYTYKFWINISDPSLISVDTIISCAYPVSFYTLNEKLFLSTDTSETDKYVDLNSFHNDSSVLVYNNLDLLKFGRANSKIKVYYIPREHLFSSVVIESDQSLFFRCIEYEFGSGITNMELKEVCIFGHTKLRKVCNCTK